MEPAAVLRLLLTAEGVRETQLQLARVNAEAKRTADSTGRLEKSFNNANNSTVKFNRNAQALGNAWKAVKWPAIIAGAAGVAPALGAVGVAAVGVVGNFTALAQGGIVAKLAFANVAEALKGNKRALDALTPAQRTFVDQLKGMKGQLDALRQTAAQNLFPGLTKALQIVEPLMGRLRPIIAGTAQELGKLAVAAAQMLVSMGPAFTRIGNTNVQILHNLGKAAIGLVQGFIGIIDAARPLALWLSQTFARLATQFGNWTQSMAGRNALQRFFEQAQPAVKAVLGLVGDLAKILFQIFRPQPGTAGMIGDLRKVLDVLGSVLKTTARTLGPPMFTLVRNLVQILGSLAGTSGPLTLLVKALAAITTPIAHMVSHNPALGTMASFLAGVGITWKVISLLVSPLERAATNVKRLVGLTSRVSAFVSSWGGLKSKVASGVEGAGTQLSLFPGKVSKSMGAAESAAKTGVSGIISRLSTGMKAGLIGVGVVLAAGLGIALSQLFKTVSPQERGREWGRQFLKAVGAAAASGHPTINPLPLPSQHYFVDQAGKWMGQWIEAMGKVSKSTALRNNPIFARFAGAVDTGQARQQATQAATGLANNIFQAFSKRMKEVHFITEPAFVQDVLLNLDQKMPMRARIAAAKLMVQYAASLEQNKKLPVGATTNLIVALESKWPKLATYLGGQSRQAAQNVADGFRMDAARKKISDTLANIRSQWGLWANWNKNTNLAGIRQNFTTTFDFLKNVIATKTGQARATAVKELNQLRHSHAAILLGMRNITGSRLSEISDIIVSKTKNAAVQGGLNIKNLQQQISHQEAVAHSATSGHLNAIANIIGTKTQQAANQGGAHMKSFEQQSVHWEQVTHSATSSHLGAIANIIGTKTQQAANQGGAHMKSFEQQTARQESAAHSATSTHLSAIASIVANKTNQAQSSAGSNFNKLASNIRSGLMSGATATFRGINYITGAVSKGLNALGSAVKVNVSLSIPKGFARGGMVDQPMYMVGEEAPRHPEVVVATNPAYRAQNVKYWAQAGKMLGMPGFEKGGIPGFKTGGYAYPYPAGTGLGRTDQGVDTGIPAGGLFRAMGDAIIGATNITGWPGGPLMNWTLQSGPARGREVYLAEMIRPLVHMGQHVSGNTAVAVSTGPSQEMGWWTGGPYGETLAKATGGYSEGQVTAAGSSFRSFIGGGKVGPALAAIASIIAPHVHGGGFLGKLVQVALDKTTTAANAFVQAHAPVMMGASGVIGPISASTGNVLRDIYKTLVARGWSKLAIAGAMGNAWRESRWNPASVGSGGGGLWGFTAHPNSLSDLQSAASHAGLPWTNVPFQTAFMASHFGDLQRLNAAGSPSAAAIDFEQIFEHAGKIAMADRIAGANRAFSMGYRHGGIVDKRRNQLPPYAGSFAGGGIVPGPLGAPRTAIVHGGERVSNNNGPLVNIEHMEVADKFDEQALAYKLAWLVET